MKRCPKCNRSYPDDNQKFCTVDGGLLVNADQAFDPNATIQSSTSNMGFPPADSAQDQTADLSATIASSSDAAETAVLPRTTGPTGYETFSRQPSAPLPPQESPNYSTTPTTTERPIAASPAAPDCAGDEEVQASPNPRRTSVAVGVGRGRGSRSLLPGDQTATQPDATRWDGGNENRQGRTR